MIWGHRQYWLYVARLQLESKGVMWEMLFTRDLTSCMPWTCWQGYHPCHLELLLTISPSWQRWILTYGWPGCRIWWQCRQATSAIGGAWSNPCLSGTQSFCQLGPSFITRTCEPFHSYRIGDLVTLIRGGGRSKNPEVIGYQCSRSGKIERSCLFFWEWWPDLLWLKLTFWKCFWPASDIPSVTTAQYYNRMSWI